MGKLSETNSFNFLQSNLPWYLQRSILVSQSVNGYCQAKNSYLMYIKLWV